MSLARFLNNIGATTIPEEWLIGSNDRAPDIASANTTLAAMQASLEDLRRSTEYGFSTVEAKLLGLETILDEKRASHSVR